MNTTILDIITQYLQPHNYTITTGYNITQKPNPTIVININNQTTIWLNDTQLTIFPQNHPTQSTNIQLADPNLLTTPQQIIQNQEHQHD